MRDATIARNYAEALLSLARTADNTAGFASLIGAIATAIRSDQSLRDFLESPKVSAANLSFTLPALRTHAHERRARRERGGH